MSLSVASLTRLGVRMRDVRSVITPCSLRQETTSGITGVTTVQTANFTYPSFRSQRSDAVSTIPRDGVYYRATPYMAFFGQAPCLPGACTFRYKPGMGSTSTYRWSWDGRPRADYLLYGCTAGLTPSLPASVVNSARAQIIGQIKANNLNLSVVVGEGTQTMLMIAGIVKELFRILDNPLRLLQYGNTRAAARAFLQYKYGIAPLMSDVTNAARALCQGLQAPVGAAKVVVMDSSYTLPVKPNLSVDNRISGKVRRGIEIGYTFELTDPEWFKAWQLGITNPLETAWELLTLSFVVDWFTGMGNFLSGLQRPLGLKFSEGYETWFLQNDILYEVCPWDSTDQVGSGDWYAQRYRSKSMLRTPVSNFTGPKPYIDFGLKSNGNVLSALALIAARI